MITIVCQTPSRIRGGQACGSEKHTRRPVLALVDKSYELCFSNWTWSKLRSPKEGFLWYAIEYSGCDRAATQHFRHCTGGYQFEGDIEAYYRELARWAEEVDEEGYRLSY